MRKKTTTSKNGKFNEYKKKKTNRDIWFTGIFFFLVFIMMMGYYVKFVSTEGRQMINNSYNSRQKLLTDKNYRGAIISADNEILAETIIFESGNEYRNYPYENLFSHVVGFSTKGKTGIEAMANPYLIHSNISLDSKIENEIAGEKNAGDNVYTSLRTDLQQIASKSLGVSKGAIIVSNVKTGEILAMVSKPDFNPCTIVEDWEGYLEDNESSVLLNRATQGIYPPGSTFKIVTSLAYLKEHNGDYQDYKYNCTGAFRYDNSKIGCYHGTVHNNVDFISSFAKSCNCSYASMGVELNRDIYNQTLIDLGFNQSLPVEFNYNQSKLVVDESVSGEDMIQISFGQGSVQMTPLHLHLITNAIAQGGTPMKPQLLTRVETVEGKVVKEFKSQSYKAYMTEEEADILKMLMTEVVESGTATKLRGLEYTAAGKTGSAEYNKVKEDSHAWFTGFAPADDPEISVTIIVERIGSGGDYAVPIAKRLFDAYFEVK
ncbi:MAG: penicillin-binding protein 2 [Lachnospiraceae bacterium]|nr:penicillin-binding protein 2 [Lachnospiraceae bacterium]